MLIKKTKFVFFLHDYFPKQRLHCVKRNATVITEGGVADIFDNTEEEYKAVPVGNEDEGVDTFLVTPKISDNTNNDTARFRKEVYGVDNDNNPTPAANDDEVTYHEWVSR